MPLFLDQDRNISKKMFHPRTFGLSGLSYLIGRTAGTLIGAMGEMKRQNLIGGDNYYHRLGMCENAKKGPADFALTMLEGIVKEGYDVVKKSPKIWGSDQTLSQKKQATYKMIDDSIKDMKNNWEGAVYGLTNQNKSCREWLKDLDIKNNVWITK